MIAFLGILVGESGFSFFGDAISGPAIYQFQQAEGFSNSFTKRQIHPESCIFPLATINAFTANVIGFTLAIEGFNIVKGWQVRFGYLCSIDMTISLLASIFNDTLHACTISATR